MKKTNPHWNTITHENSSVRLFEFLVLVANLTDGQTVTWLKKTARLHCPWHFSTKRVQLL